MGYLNTIEQVRGIDWGQSYLWDIKFENAPSPFSEWFPATDYSLDDNIGISLTLSMFLSSYKIPQGTGCKGIACTVLDDQNRTLYKWLKNWYDDIYDQFSGVLTLQEAVRNISVAQLNKDRSVNSTRNFMVFPDQNIMLAGNSVPDTLQYTLNFAVAGEF